MEAKKHPVGTKVIFIAKPGYDEWVRGDSGKTATIVRDCGSHVDIFIPGSRNNSLSSKVTWCTSWDDIKLLKGQQLLFDFMEKGGDTCGKSK